ncbi:MAG: tellurite resistance TerB C-terminal domain-containing protein [Reichenbachiella sp.]|uniref:tellurite resistance TerB C-terminal domain-containing protein n=1 Tax=Reichenbachiella sp. TaxID=2184521 RepID=UPI003267F61E
MALAIAINVQASDYYVATTDLNIRSGTRVSFQVLHVLEKGDTVLVLDSINSVWAKVQYKDVVGFSSTKYLQKIDFLETPKVDNSNIPSISSIAFLVFLSGVMMLLILVNSYRNKTLASLISLFYGAFGFQKFYLGQTNKGILSVLFCWTFIPMVIGLFDFISLAAMNKSTFNYKYNNGVAGKKQTLKKENEIDKNDADFTIEIKPSSLTVKRRGINFDDTIIDVSSTSFDTSIDQLEFSEEDDKEVPHWDHTYIYSNSEIEYANREQKKFYQNFRTKFLKFEKTDIQGYTNYAFILYFDLLEDFEKHQDIKLLEKQFELLVSICPETGHYAFASLTEKLRSRSDQYSNDRLKEFLEPSYQFEHGYSQYDPDLYKLGNRYKDKLSLSKQEISWLNKFYDPTNVFTSIQGCSVAVIKLYLKTLNQLNDTNGFGDLSLNENLDALFKEVIIEEKLKFDPQYEVEDRAYSFHRMEEAVFLSIFKLVENEVRLKFRHKRKLSIDSFYPYHNSTPIFEKRFAEPIKKCLSENLDTIDKPDSQTESALNALNVTRWKDEFLIITDSFHPDRVVQFRKKVGKLLDVNKDNPNIEKILYESAKYIAKYSKVDALKYYAMYHLSNFTVNKFSPKELPKSVNKILFEKEGQIAEFKLVIKELLRTSNTKKAFASLSQFYVPKRKIIELDKTEIKRVEEKHEGTVNLLSEYMEVEEVEENVEILKESNSTYSSQIIRGIEMNEIQEELVKRIISNSFQIHQDDVAELALENGMFKNQLIDSINELCSELLEGEALIEEDEENYIIEESYYKEIAL